MFLALNSRSNGMKLTFVDKSTKDAATGEIAKGKEQRVCVSSRDVTITPVHRWTRYFALRYTYRIVSIISR